MNQKRKTKNEIQETKEFMFVMGTKRIEALSDGVFSIAMTLLVLGLAVPVLEDPFASRELFIKLLEMLPKFIVYTVSFIVLGIFWILHKRQLNFIMKSNGMFLWINIFFLMVASLIPFSTALLGNYPGNRIAVIIYGINFLAGFQFLFLKWTYATSRLRLADPRLPKTIIKKHKIGLLAVSLGIIIAVILSLIDTRLSLIIFAITAVVLVLYIMTRGHSAHVGHKLMMYIARNIKLRCFGR